MSLPDMEDVAPVVTRRERGTTMGLPSMEEALTELDIEWPRDRKIACPLCDSNETPALHLYDDHWYCFSCGKNGDGIGLVAAYTNVNVRTLIAQRSNGRAPLARVGPRLQPQDVNKAVKLKWRKVHDWWFALLSDMYKGAQMWAFERALDLYSDMFDGLTGEIMGDWGEPLKPFEAEQRIEELRKNLVRAEPFERKAAMESRLR